MNPYYNTATAPASASAYPSFGYSAPTDSSFKPTQYSSEQEVRLFNSNPEREAYESMADLFSIIVATEQLEKAYLRDTVSTQEYTPACLKLISQFKTAINDPSIPNLEGFLQQYKLRQSCPLGLKRLMETGVPATVEHATTEAPSAASVKYSVDTTQGFITLMDALKLNLVAVDQIHPLLSDLVQNLNKVTHLPPDYTGKKRIVHWLITLNKMKASDTINEEQTRQLLFDLESAYSEFRSALSK
ncbi:VPS28 protein-domain-containing protein [Polychytrium aggregatum]|uniref:VPS28 protein-domain-containing protein n=1 Tax=Polychytrium aggregatum TaxID=110093 RepID=UPI0022FEEC61|nr:VPS28 protein-domain-containing protein [Polychytrium aggregatum]KAI9207436.1 VPS28 protein-domain-containing protein [Polychytrium aggregatum]